VSAQASGSHRLLTPPASALRGRVRLGPADAAIFETFVVPRYMALFGELVLELMVEIEEAQIVHLHCRTGYPDRGIAMKLPGANIIGLDTSAAALELARAKAATMPEMISDYRLLENLPTPLPESAFSHGVTLHPLADADDRGPLLAELARVLAPNGQALVAMPLRGSFQELGDLLREYALKQDEPAVGRAAEQSMLRRPTVEMLSTEFEQAGFDFVDVSWTPATLGFRSGRDFFEDPIARLVVLPELRHDLQLEDPEKALLYVRDAIDKYWSDGTFELTVNVGCATARKA
jgi:SAM-dependent methyltransferase